MTQYFTIPEDNHLRNCSRHTFQKVGLIKGYDDKDKDKLNMVMQCVYCGRVEVKDENGR